MRQAGDKLHGLGSDLLGGVGKDLRAILRGEEGWTGPRRQGPVWRPELRDTL